VRLNEEAEEYLWVTPEEALTLPVEHYTAVVIRTYLQRQGQRERSCLKDEYGPSDDTPMGMR